MFILLLSKYHYHFSLRVILELPTMKSKYFKFKNNFMKLLFLRVFYKINNGSIKGKADNLKGSFRAPL